LGERIQELVKRDGLSGGPALLKIVALENPSDRDPRGEADESFRSQSREPPAVELNDGLFGIGNRESLLGVGLCVRLDLLWPELRPRRLLARRIADHPRKVADHKDDAMPGVLKLTHLAEDDGVAEVDVRCGGIEADLDRQGSTALELSREVFLLDQVHD